MMYTYSVSTKRSLVVAVVALTVVMSGQRAQAQPGTVLSHKKISSTLGNFHGILDNDDRFGAVASLGDLDGDGVGDLCKPLLSQGVNFFTDPAAFEAALLATDKRAKAGWNFKPHNVAAGNFRLLDDPLNILTHAADPGDPWANFPSGDCCFANGTPGCSDPTCQAAVCLFDPFCCNVEWDFMCGAAAAADPDCDCSHVIGNNWPATLDNVTFQSNLGPNPQPPLPNPRGANALRLRNAGSFYPDSNTLVANFFVDSFDILSGPPAVPPDNHTAMSFEIVTVVSGPPPGPVLVTVYDKNEVPVGKITIPIVVNPPPGDTQRKAFLGVIMDPGLTVGRVNLFDLGGGAEGISEITVYEDFTGASNADITGPTSGVPDGCVDSFDLNMVLAAWCSASTDPDPPGDVDPPCEGCVSPDFLLADISGPDGAPDGCVDSFDLNKVLASWCSALGANPCGTCQ